MNKEKLKAEMVLNNITGEELAKKCGMSSASWYNKINGRNEFTLGEVNTIKKVLRLNKDRTHAIFFAN